MVHGWHLLSGTLGIVVNVVVIYMGIDFAMDQPRDSERYHVGGLSVERPGCKPVPRAGSGKCGSCF